MRIFLAIALFISSGAYAAEIDLVKKAQEEFSCDKIDSEHDSCAPTLDASNLTEPEVYDLGNYQLLLMPELMAYQRNFNVFLYKDGKLYSLPQLVEVSVDKKNEILYSSSKGRGGGDIGTALFYKIDPKNASLILLNEFKTSESYDDNGNIKHVTENGAADEAFGYITRAEAYAKKMKWDFE